MEYKIHQYVVTLYEKKINFLWAGNFRFLLQSRSYEETKNFKNPKIMSFS